MTKLAISLLGPFQASLDGRPIDGFQTRKVQALLIYLAAEPEKHMRESLMELMWPGMPDRSARHNLRQVLYYLRSAIPELQSNQDEERDKVPAFLTNRQMIQLNPEATVKVDVAQFMTLVNGVQNHEHLNILTCQTCLSDLKTATDIYLGDFLVDFYLDDSNVFEDWAQMTRETYRRRALDALELQTAAATRQREYPQAQSLAKRQLEIDNLRENAYRQLMEVLALAGHREEALAVYDDCRRLLVEELGMEPTKRTTEIADMIQSGNLRFDITLTQGVRGYDLREGIGVGSFGIIHRGYQSAVDREVAIKVISQQYANDQEFIRRFEDEAQTVARLEHPFIVPLYDYWRDPDGAYLVMRLLKGGSLLTALEKSPWDLEPASTMLDQLASALNIAHRQGIVHRDIKPANILLDENGNAYLSDFGIAKDVGANLGFTAEGAILGTPDYISPKQILNEEVGPPSDIYSLGAVLFETLAGEKPFSDSSVANLLHKQLNDPFPLVSVSRPGLPPQIDDVIQRATAKRPADRYHNALEMAVAFREVVGGSSVSDPASRPIAISVAEELYNPYKGLQAFQEADTDDFFGRNALIDRLIKRLAPSNSYSAERGPFVDGERFVALVGPSGSGKSSAIKAGMIPALRSGEIPNSDKWFFAEMVPGTHPLEELEMALWSVAVNAPPSLIEPMKRDVRGILRTIRRILPETNDGQKSELVLIIDQFEELFTLVGDEEQRNFFLESLLAAISAPRSPLRVIITLRADFYDRPLQFQALGNLLKEATEIVLPMTIEELTWAVREPARRVGVTLEEGLAEIIVNDVADQPGSLPLMQYALTELFERRQGTQMTRSAYQEIGGVMGALGRRAEELYGSLNEEEREAVRQLFLRLVTLGEGVEDTRRRVLKTEIEAIAKPHSPVSNVIDIFGAARLLTFDHDPSTRAATIEVAHEALLREWFRLRTWLDENRDDIRLQQRLSLAAREWLAADKDASYLLHGARLAQLEGWSEASGIALTQDENSFLLASIGARQADEEARRQQELATAQKLVDTERARAETESKRASEQAKAAQRLRNRAYFLVGVLVLAAILAVVAVINGNRAIENANVAQENLALAISREAEAVAHANSAATQESLAEQNLVLATTREAEAKDNFNLALTRQAEAETEAIARAAAEAEALVSAAEAQNVALISGSQAALANKDVDTALALAWQAVKLNPDSKLAQAQLSEVAYTPGTVRQFTGQSGEALQVENSPDGRTMLSGYSDGAVIHWEIDTGDILWQENQNERPINDIAISSDGQIAATVSDEITFLWDLKTGQVIHRLDGHEEFITRAAFSPEGKNLATGGWGDTSDVVIWDVDSGAILRRFEDTSRIEDLEFHPDGTSILFGGFDDGTLTMMDVQSGQVIHEMNAGLDISSGTLRAIAVSPDGQRALSGFENSDMILWDLSSGEILRRYKIPEGAHSITFHPDNQAVLTSGLGGFFKLIDLQTGETLFDFKGHSFDVTDVDFTPDGNYAVSASRDKTIRLWQLGNGHVIKQFATPRERAFEVDLSPDGRTVLSSSADGAVILWDVETGEIIRQLTVDQPIMAATFSPDGTKALIGTGYRLAQKLEPGHVIFWDLQTGEEIHRFEGHPYVVFDVEFSPDGKRAISSGSGPMIILWDLETGQAIRRFDDYFVDIPWPHQSFWDVAFNPDGTSILASFGQGPLFVLDLETGVELDQLDGHIDIGATGIEFTRDGELAISGGWDSQVILWDMQNRQIIRRFTNHVGSVGQVSFSPDERLLLGGSSDGTNSLWDVESGEVIRRYGGGFGIHPVFNADGTKALVGFHDGAMELWRMDTSLEQLLTWTESNRYIPELTCEQRLLYDVEPYCETVD